MHSSLPTLTALLTSLMLLGCSGSTSDSAAPVAGSAGEEHHDHDDHDHHEGHDHPETLAEGLEELTELRNTVRDAFAADDIDTAHGPLHDVGHLLEDISGLVEKQELTQEQRDMAKENIEALFDLFGAVDRTLHGQDGSTYSEASAKIDAAIAALQGIATPEEAAPEEQAPAEDASEEAASEEDAGEEAAPNEEAPEATEAPAPEESETPAE